MKIGMILDNEFTGDLRVENEIISLQNAGHQVYLLCLNFGNQKPYEIFNGAKVFRIPIKEKIKKKLAGLNNTFFNFYPIFWSKHIVDFAKSNKINALHVHDLWMLNSGLRANKKLNLPLVADLHENFVEALKQYKYANIFPNKLLISKKRWATSEKEWCQKADALITVIDEAVERYSGLGIEREKIYVVPNYINLKTFEKYSIEQTIIDKYSKYFTVVYTGGFDTHRGLETLIDATKILVNRIDNLKVVLVGSGSNFNSLKQQANNLDLTEIIDFEGWQSASLLPSYIKAADVGVIPHLKTKHTDNTIPHKLFHYMYFSKPVVASNCNPLVRILNEEKAGVIFNSGDAADLANKVLSIYKDKNLAKIYGENGRKAVLSKYNWEKASQKLIELYEKLEKEING